MRTIYVQYIDGKAGEYQYEDMSIYYKDGNAYITYNFGEGNIYVVIPFAQVKYIESNFMFGGLEKK